VFVWQQVCVTLGDESVRKVLQKVLGCKVFKIWGLKMLEKKIPSIFVILLDNSIDSLRNESVIKILQKVLGSKMSKRC